MYQMYQIVQVYREFGKCWTQKWNKKEIKKTLMIFKTFWDKSNELENSKQ